jgi:hypothetical protein
MTFKEHRSHYWILQIECRVCYCFLYYLDEVVDRLNGRKSEAEVPEGDKAFIASQSELGQSKMLDGTNIEDDEILRGIGSRISIISN